MKKIALILMLGIIVVSFGCKKAEVKKTEIKKDNSKVLERAKEDQKELTEEVEKY